MRKILVGLAMLAAVGLGVPAAAAQGVRYDSSVTMVSSAVPPGAQAPLFTVPYAVVTVCAYPAAGDPCTNTVPVYSDQALTMPLVPPITADGAGRFGFWVGVGTYSYTLTSPGGRLLGTYAFSVGGTGGGGSGTVQSVAGTAANGFTWSIASPTTNPNLTLNTDSTHFLPTKTGSASQYWNGAGGLSTPAGGIASVGLAMPTSLFSVSGSPLTAPGTISVGLATQMSTCFFASPTGGGTPLCRGIVGTDLPAATNTTFGAIKPDNMSCTVTEGVLTCGGGAVLLSSAVNQAVTQVAGTTFLPNSLDFIQMVDSTGTHSYATIQAAIDSLPTTGNQGGVIYVPPGTYACPTSPMTTSGVSIIGLGTPTPTTLWTTFNNPDTFNSFLAGPTLANQVVIQCPSGFTLKDANRTKFENIVFDMQGTGCNQWLGVAGSTRNSFSVINGATTCPVLKLVGDDSYNPPHGANEVFNTFGDMYLNGGNIGLQVGDASKNVSTEQLFYGQVFVFVSTQPTGLYTAFYFPGQDDSNVFSGGIHLAALPSVTAINGVMFGTPGSFVDTDADGITINAIYDETVAAARTNGCPIVLNDSSNNSASFGFYEGCATTVYSSGQDYPAGWFVTNGGTTYMAILPSGPTSGGAVTPGTNAAYWQTAVIDNINMQATITPPTTAAYYSATTSNYPVGSYVLYGAGAVGYVTVTSGGSGYTSAPTVTFSGGCSTTPTGGASVIAGIVTGVGITNAGSGCTSAPSVTFSGGGGSGAVGTAYLSGSVYAAILANGTSSSVEAPTNTAYWASQAQNNPMLGRTLTGSSGPSQGAQFTGAPFMRLDSGPTGLPGIGFFQGGVPRASLYYSGGTVFFYGSQYNYGAGGNFSSWNTASGTYDNYGLIETNVLTVDPCLYHSEYGACQSGSGQNATSHTIIKNTTPGGSSATQLEIRAGSGQNGTNLTQIEDVNGNFINGYSWTGLSTGAIGTVISGSSGTINPTAPVTPISGAYSIGTITVPPGCSLTAQACTMTLLMAAGSSFNTSGNIGCAATFASAQTVQITYYYSGSVWYHNACSQTLPTATQAACLAAATVSVPCNAGALAQTTFTGSGSSTPATLATTSAEGVAGAQYLACFTVQTTIAASSAPNSYGFITYTANGNSGLNVGTQLVATTTNGVANTCNTIMPDSGTAVGFLIYQSPATTGTPTYVYGATLTRLY